MAVSHASLGLISMVFLAGSLAMIFLVVLAGVTATPPLNNTYFLQADTAGITGARGISQWTYFYVCGDGNTDCGGAVPAPPFGYAWSGNAANVPDDLMGPHGGNTTSSYYFYMWRFGWVFYLVSLFFDTFAFFTSFLACCGRLGSAVSGFVTLLTLFFYTIAVSLMTATFVRARDVFQANNRSAQIGTYAFGFSWGAWTALLISLILFTMGTGFRKGDGVSSRHGWRRGWRRRSTRSRRSREAGGRRVKDDYS